MSSLSKIEQNFARHLHPRTAQSAESPALPWSRERGAGRERARIARQPAVNAASGAPRHSGKNLQIWRKAWQNGRAIATHANRPFLSADRPLAFAHRGGAGLWPENTLVAFEQALALGCRYLETDVHVTRDGQVVVLHDARLERTTDGEGWVAEHTLSELRRLDAGFRFSPRASAGATHAASAYPWRGRGLFIPRFEELLELSDAARFNVELKSRDPRLVRAFWRIVETHHLHDRVLVAAAVDPIVRAFRQLSRGRVATSASRREVTAFWASCRARVSSWIPVQYDALQVPRRSGRLTIVDPAFIAAAHARGLHVHVRTIDEPDAMSELLDLGVDGIMTDRPDRLRELLGTRER